jgi:hypothetical protein
MKFELVINLEAAKALVPRSEVSDQYDWRYVARQESGSNSPAGVFIISFPICGYVNVPGTRWQPLVYQR